MWNKFIFIILAIFLQVSLLSAQSDSTRTWHLQWEYSDSLIDSDGPVDNFIISRINHETSEEKKTIVLKNDWNIIKSEGGNSTFRQQDADLLPGIIYAYTVTAASSDTITSPPSNVAQGAIPKIDLTRDSWEFEIDAPSGEVTGVIPVTLIDLLNENLVLSHTKEIQSPSGGTIFNDTFTATQFSFTSNMDSGEVAHINLTATNPDTSKDFFYTKRITLFFTSDSVDEPVEHTTPTVSVTTNSAHITWQTTRPSRDHIIFGLTHDKTMQSDTDPSLITNHERTLTVLQPATLYYYQIVSHSATSGPYYSPEYQFLTDALPEVARKTRIFPGKFIASQHDHINFYDIPAGGSVSIYSWVGDVVYENKDMVEGDFEWLVKNPSGENISSGFYLYFIKDQSGKVEAQGKFIVVR